MASRTKSSLLYNEIVLPVRDRMFRYACAITKEAETAQDVVQECLLKIWNKRDTLKEIKNPEAWVFRIVRNGCLDALRTNRFTTLDYQEEMVHQSSTTEDVIFKDQYRWFREAVDSLPDKQKDTFHLREVEGMSYQEISDILEISLDEVKVNLHRARTKVRKTMQNVEAYGIAN
ncbi:MAG: sigma-70 family RNA polymerase sigma factor [bacterium]|nr:sigma-70 family RNA polymerase sigma factor [bacterium]